MENVAQDARRVKWVGIGLIVFGVLAILAPLLTGVAIGISVGICLGVCGLLRLFHAFRVESGRARTHGILLGALALLCGIIMALDPVFALGFLSILLIVWLGMDGIAKVSAALQLKPTPGWGWTLFSGVVSLLLGLMLLMGWPLSGAWAVGVFAGVWALFTGWALVNLASVAKEAEAAA